MTSRMQKVSSHDCIKSANGLGTRSTRWSILQPADTPHRNVNRQLLTGTVRTCVVDRRLLCAHHPVGLLFVCADIIDTVRARLRKDINGGPLKGFVYCRMCVDMIDCTI